MTSYNANTATWIEAGKKASNGNQALYGIFALFSLLFVAVQVIVQNQLDLYDAITGAQNGPRKPSPAVSTTGRPAA